MTTLQELTKYHQFTEYTVDELMSIYKTKISMELTHSNNLSQLQKSIHNNLTAIESFKQQNPIFSNHLTAYKDTLIEMNTVFEREKDQANLKAVLDQSVYLSLLQSCKFSYFQNERSFLCFAKDKLNEYNTSILQKSKIITEKIKTIEKRKQIMFIQSILILNKLDQSKIQQKGILTQQHKRYSYLEPKIIQAKDLQTQTKQIEDFLISQYQQLEALEDEKQRYFEQVYQQITNINMGKVMLLEKLCLEMSPFYIRQSEDLLFLPALQQTDKQIVDISQFLAFYSNLQNLLKWPKLSVSPQIQQKKELKEQLSKLGDSQDLKIVDDEVPDYGSFMKSLQHATHHPFTSQTEARLFYSFLEKCLKYNLLLNAFLQFLLTIEEGTAQLGSSIFLFPQNMTIDMINILLNLVERQQAPQMQSAVKIIILSYSMNSLEEQQLEKCLIKYRLWKSIRFWEISFLQSIYQNLQFLYIDNSGLKRYCFEHWSSTHQANWFSSIFRSKLQIQQQKKMDQQVALTKYYQQIFKGVSVVYLSLMIFMQVSTQIRSSFKKIIYKSVIKLKWPPETGKWLQQSFEITQNRSKESIKKLITNRRVIMEIMHKKDEKEELELSLYSLVSMWLRQTD